MTEIDKYFSTSFSIYNGILINLFFNVQCIQEKLSFFRQHYE